MSMLFQFPTIYLPSWRNVLIPMQSAAPFSRAPFIKIADDEQSHVGEMPAWHIEYECRLGTNGNMNHTGELLCIVLIHLSSM